MTYLRPNNPGDATAQDLHDWSVELERKLVSLGHPTTAVLDDTTPCDRATSSSALQGSSELVVFSGHGTKGELLGTAGTAAVSRSTIANASGKTIVAVACLAGVELGPAAVNAGVTAFLGWNVKLLWLSAPLGQLCPFGAAIVNSLETLGHRCRVEQVKEALRDALNDVAEQLLPYANPAHPNEWLAYYAAGAAATQVALCGQEKVVPL